MPSSCRRSASDRMLHVLGLCASWYGMLREKDNDDESQAGCHVDLRVAVIVIKRFEFLFESVCNDVQVASDDVR